MSEPRETLPSPTLRELEDRAQELAGRRDAFLRGIQGRWLATDEERATWAGLSAERRALDVAFRVYELEQRIAQQRRSAEAARGAGDAFGAEQCEAEASYLCERLAEVRNA